MIAAWWRQWPDANIGIATGEPSGIDVLDIDPRNGGDDNLRELVQEYGPLPETAMSITGGLGYHYLFRHSPEVRNGPQSVGTGIDIKTTGGYIVAPPSMHSSGRRYCWEGASHPDEVGIAEIPDWLLALIRGRNNKRVQVQVPEETIVAGSRNNSLASYGGCLRRAGLDATEIDAALQAINTRRCRPPLPADEVRCIAGSLARYPTEGAVSSRRRGKFMPPGYNDAFSAFMDVVRFAPDLPHAQFLVLLFHVERTLGYGKPSDCTSISQMVNGVPSRKQKTWVRAGCGLTKAAIVKANRALTRPPRQFLHVRHQRSPERGHEATEFEVNWETLGRYIAERKQQPIPPLVSERDKQLEH